MCLDCHCWLTIVFAMCSVARPCGTLVIKHGNRTSPIQPAARALGTGDTSQAHQVAVGICCKVWRWVVDQRLGIIDVYQKLNEKKRSSSWCTYYRYVKMICLMYCPGICNIFMMIVRRTRVCHKLGWDTPKLYFQLLNDSEALIFGVPFFWTNPRVRSVHPTPSITQMLGGSTISLGPKCYWWYWWGYAHPGSRMWQHQPHVPAALHHPLHLLRTSSLAQVRCGFTNWEN